MSETRISFEDEEPSAEHSAIRVADVQTRLPQLEKKLEEYRQRAADKGLGDISPEQVVFHGGRYSLFKATALESVIQLATEKSSQDMIYLYEVALLVQDKTSISVTRAATIPFRYNAATTTYEPDLPRLLNETSMTEADFSDAYAVIRAYCSGDTRGIIGGTGLPEA